VRNVHAPATETTLKEVGAMSGSTNRPLQRTGTRLRASPVPIRSPEASRVPTIPLPKITDGHHPGTPLYLDLFHACTNIQPDHKSSLENRSPASIAQYSYPVLSFVPCFIILTLFLIFFTLFYLPIWLLHPFYISTLFHVTLDLSLVNFILIYDLLCAPENLYLKCYPTSQIN
jgi:hypothetical protein